MNSAYFKIIRPVNLGIIILTMLLLRFCIVEVYLGLSGASPALGYVDFGTLVLATVLIGAGGYIINDLYDLGTDRINKPGKVIVGNLIPVASAWRYYAAVTLTGMAGGFYLAFRVDYVLLGFLFPAVAIMLYFYSARYQKIILAGNLMTALMSALVILVTWLFEFFALKNDPIRFVDALQQLPVIQIIVAGYAFFAFFVSLLREIVKDAEDREGDEKGGYKTFVVVYGVRATKGLAASIHLVTMVLLGAAMILLYREGLMLVFWYVAVALLPLFGYILYQLNTAGNKKDFQFLSNAYKLIMLAGILSMELFYISY